MEQVQVEELEEQQSTQQDKIGLVKYLYNDGYGEIDVSQECRDKYKELFLEDLPEDIMGCRSNQNLIKVFELLGSDKCSGSPSCIRLSVQWIPKEMEEYISIYNYDGQETVSIDYNEAYSVVLHELMKHNCHGTNNLQYVMSSCWSSSVHCDCIPKDAREKYQRITYIKEKMRALPRRYSKEMPDAMIFSYEL